MSRLNSRGVPARPTPLLSRAAAFLLRFCLYSDFRLLFNTRPLSSRARTVADGRDGSNQQKIIYEQSPVVTLLRVLHRRPLPLPLSPRIIAAALRRNFVSNVARIYNRDSRGSHTLPRICEVIYDWPDRPAADDAAF